MSRNDRKRRPQTPVKPVKKTANHTGSDTTTTSILLTSDDETGYSGVEDVSESDEAEINEAEEKFLIDRFSASRKKRSPPRPHVPEEDGDADEEADADDDADADAEEEEDEDGDFGGLGDGEYDNWEGFPDSTTPEQVDHSLEDQDCIHERRVRFTGVPDSDSDSTTSDLSGHDPEFFPDLFVDQNSLDLSFKRQIEVEDDASSTSSYWDLNPNAEPFAENPWQGYGPSMYNFMPRDGDDCFDNPTATPMPPTVPASDVSSPTPTDEDEELDGYESDGETTEEDDTQPILRQKQMQRFSHTEPSPDSDMEKATPVRRGRPRVGRFDLYASEKPVAVLNPTTRKMMIFTPQRRNQFNPLTEGFDEVHDATQNLAFYPLLPDPGSLMMAAMSSSNAFGPFLAQQPTGPTEAFYQPRSSPATDDYSDHSDPSQEDEGEMDLRVEDFLCWGDSSDDEAAVGPEVPNLDGEPASSPSRPQTAASGVSAATDCSVDETQQLFNHFNKNSDVGAYRRNQHNQKLLSNGKATQESLAFSNNLHIGTLRGIKMGSLETVTTPITPHRRRKRSIAMNAPVFVPDLQSRQGSPPQKRKSLSQHNDEPLHKKQRSISEIGSLDLQR